MSGCADGPPAGDGSHRRRALPRTAVDTQIAMRQGLGRRLLRRAIEWAGREPLWLTTYAHIPWNRCDGRSTSRPIVRRQTRHPREVPQVVRHERAPERDGVRGDEHVEFTDGRPAFGEDPADSPELDGRLVIERRHLDRRHEGIDQAMELP